MLKALAAYQGFCAWTLVVSHGQGCCQQPCLMSAKAFCQGLSAQEWKQILMGTARQGLLLNMQQGFRHQPLLVTSKQGFWRGSWELPCTHGLSNAFCTLPCMHSFYSSFWSSFWRLQSVWGFWSSFWRLRSAQGLQEMPLYCPTQGCLVGRGIWHIFRAWPLQVIPMWDFAVEKGTQQGYQGLHLGLS